MFIKNLRWLFSKNAEAHAHMIDHLARMSRDTDRAFILRELAEMHRRVTVLQRSLMATAIAGVFLGLGEIVRWMVLLIG